MKIKPLIITFSCLLVFVFSSCQDAVNQYQYNTYNSSDDSDFTLEELKTAVIENLSSIKFNYDVNTDSLFSEFGKYKVVLDTNSVSKEKIEDQKLNIDYKIVYCTGGGYDY